MSWIPASGIYEPNSRTAPRPAAAADTFTFGHASAGAGAAPHQPAAQDVPISARPERANFDAPVAELRWWQQPRDAVTVSGSTNADIAAYWSGRKSGVPDAAGAPGDAAARTANKAQGLGSSIKASLVDCVEERSLAGAESCYKADMLAGHVRVGKRGVCLSAEATAQYEASRAEAAKNKAVGSSTNMRLGLF